MTTPSALTLQLTTNPGFEDLALAELVRLAAPVGPVHGELCPDGLAGHVLAHVAATWEQAVGVVERLRSVHRVVRRVGAFQLDEVDPLGQVRREVALLAPSIPELQPADATFRVTSSRSGSHPFTSEDVERIAGAGVRDALPRAVSLRAHDVELRCDVRGSSCTVGVQIAGLSRRATGPYSQRTSLRANLAWCLLELARPDMPPRALLDPCCGAGTLLVEAGLRWPEVALTGIDRREEAAAGTLANLQRHGLGARAAVHLGDARSPGELGPFDTVVTNPPFGRRLGQDLHLPTFYAELLRGAAQVCTDDARMVVLAQRRGAFNLALQRGVGWVTRHVRVVELGGLYVGVFVLGRG